MVDDMQEHYGMQARPITDPEELSTVVALRERIALIPAALAEWTRVARIKPRPGSQIALDDEITSWRNLSHSINHQLNHAADALNSLSVLIPAEGEFRLPFMSHFPVARSGLEAASLALWVLAPDDPRVRIERQIKNAWRELSEEASMNAAIAAAIDENPHLGSRSDLDKGRKQMKEWKKTNVDQIRGVARSIGVDDPTQSTWKIGFAEVVREATVEVGLPGIYGESVWRDLSALSHPSMIRATRSMRTEQIRDNGDGTLGVVLTSNLITVKSSVEAAHLQFLTAARKFGARKISAGDRADYRRAGYRGASVL